MRRFSSIYIYKYIQLKPSLIHGIIFVGSPMTKEIVRQAIDHDHALSATAKTATTRALLLIAKICGLIEWIWKYDMRMIRLKIIKFCWCHNFYQRPLLHIFIIIWVNTVFFSRVASIYIFLCYGNFPNKLFVHWIILFFFGIVDARPLINHKWVSGIQHFMMWAQELHIPSGYCIVMHAISWTFGSCAHPQLILVASFGQSDVGIDLHLA